MNIIEDTRQKIGQHKLKNMMFEKMGVGVVRCALPYGDYCLAPKVVVDTKKNISELAANVVQDHARLKESILKSNKNNCKMIFLIENNDGVACLDDLQKWENPRLKEWARKVERGELSGKNPPISGKRLMLSCQTMQERYGCFFYFCTPKESARFVVKLLS